MFENGLEFNFVTDSVRGNDGEGDLTEHDAPSAYLSDETLDEMATIANADINGKYDTVTCVGYTCASETETDSDVQWYRKDGTIISHGAARTIAAWYQTSSARGCIFAAFACGNLVYADVLIDACHAEAFRAPTATTLDLYALVGYVHATRNGD